MSNRAAEAAVEALTRVGALESAYGEFVAQVRDEIESAAKPPPAPLALPAPSQPAADLSAAIAGQQQQQQQMLLLGGLVLGVLLLLRGRR